MPERWKRRAMVVGTRGKTPMGTRKRAEETRNRKEVVAVMAEERRSRKKIIAVAVAVAKEEGRKVVAVVEKEEGRKVAAVVAERKKWKPLLLLLLPLPKMMSRW